VKPIPGPVAAALANGFPSMSLVELYIVTLVDEVTTFRWCTWDHDLDWDGDTYTAQNPFLKRGKWRLSNTMEVPTLDVQILSLVTGFNGGLSVRAQATQGLFDGATLQLNELYLDNFDNFNPLGEIEIFGGVVSTLEPKGSGVVMKVKGANNKLDLSAPRRLYQIGCNNTFCDSGCTLSRAAFTTSFIVAAAPTPTRSFIPWATPPGTPANFQLGTLTMTNGPASGQSMDIEFADADGCYLAFPLYNTPVVGNTFDAFEGCPKTRTVCEGRSNDQNGLWFPYIPAAETAF